MKLTIRSEIYTNELPLGALTMAPEHSVVESFVYEEKVDHKDIF